MLATLDRGRRTIPPRPRPFVASESKLARRVTPCGEHRRRIPIRRFFSREKYSKTIYPRAARKSLKTPKTRCYQYKDVWRRFPC